MGSFKDIMPSQQGWLHELARAEVHPDAEKLLQLGASFDPQQLVEESTIDFLTGLREHLTEFAKVFNAYSDGSTKFQDIKVYSIAQTAADFMMFRNQVKLVVSNAAHGVIQISFAQHVRGTLNVNGESVQAATAGGARPEAVQASSNELLAQVGPFRDVWWTFQGERVEAEKVAKFYFVEFARMTRDTRRSRTANQLLLDQIKALLQEKGLDL